MDDYIKKNPFKRMAWPERPALWDEGHQVKIRVDDQWIHGTVDRDKTEQAPRDPYNDFKVADLGRVTISGQGTHSLEIVPLKINSENKAGLSLRMIRLVPENGTKHENRDPE